MKKLSEFIGKGERTAKQILKFIFPNDKIKEQVPLKDLVGQTGLSQRQIKESIDLVVYTDTTIYAVRVNGKDHKGKKYLADGHQKSILKSLGIRVIDLEWYDCPNLFKEQFNQESKREVLEAFGL